MIKMTMITYKFNENSVKLYDSCNVRKRDFDTILSWLKNDADILDRLHERTIPSMRYEWAAHNLAYILHIRRKNTKEVDLNYHQEWWMKMLYGIAGRAAMLFIA